jgi:trigger factor
LTLQSVNAKFVGFEKENRRKSVKVEIQETSQIARQMEVSIPWEDIAKDFSNHFQKYAKELHIPGFRKGHVPRSIVQRQFGKKIQYDFFQENFNRFYIEALKEGGVSPISEPELLEISFEEGSDLNFTLVFEVLPSFDLPDYKEGFEIDVPRYAVEDADVEEALKQIVEQRTSMEPVEGAAQEGHYVDYTELKAGDEIGVNKQTILGADAEKKAIEEQLIGMKAEESKEVEIDGESVMLTLNKVSNQIKPEINDEFAQSLGESVKDVEDLKKQLKQQIISRWDSEESKIRDAKIRSYFIDALKDLEMPQNLVEGYLDDMISNLEMKYKYNIQGNEAIRENLKPQALDELKWQLVKDRLIELELIEVSEADLDAHINELMKGVEEAQREAYRNYYRQKEPRSQLRYYLVEDEVMKYLLRYAKIKRFDVNREQRMKGEK